MYLENWMVVTLIVAFGFCAIYNRRAGYNQGGITALKSLVEQKLIRITDEGKIVKG